MRRLQSTPGIGKRIAERIVSELREKVGIEPPDDGRSSSAAPTSRMSWPRAGLLELGYEPGEADTLLRAAAGETAEELLASALKGSRR